MVVQQPAKRLAEQVGVEWVDFAQSLVEDVAEFVTSKQLFLQFPVHRGRQVSLGHWLEARARRITDPELKRSFLADVPEHARTLELARAWGVKDAARELTALSSALRETH